MIARIRSLIRRGVFGGWDRLGALGRRLRLWGRRDRTRGADAHESGRWGERVAEHLLRKKGYRILGRGVRLSARDELDLVARYDDVLVFVEVKTRKNEDFGRPIAALNPAKRRAMTRAAMRYLQRLKTKPPFIRFDVVEVVGAPGQGQPVVRHIESCFTLNRSRCIPW